MKIYQVNLNNRLGQVFDPIPDDTELDKEYFLIVHPKDADRSVDKDLPRWLKDSKCNGILYVKGVPNAGLPREKAKSLESENNQKVHFLSYSIGDSSDLVDELKGRFSRFFEEVEYRDKIDWRLIDESWPENLLAIYFIAKAISCLDSESLKVLLARREDWTPLWQRAKNEYYLRTGDNLDYEDLSADNASGVADALMSCLKGL